MTAGSEEPNALVTVGSGGNQEPNVRATVQEIKPGLDVRSQNAWPALKFDALAINDLASSFLGAGFYYKTFMWPKAAWERVYEPLIRRAAGLGALSAEAVTDRYEKAFAFCDVLVIGTGPAGLMAALVAGRAGADVIVAEEDHLTGGRLNAETHQVGDVTGSEWAALATRELNDLANVRIMTRTTVTGAYDQGTFGALERSAPAASPDCPKETFWRIAAKHAVMATGSLERTIAFPDNDRPGIMTAGAVRTYLNRYGVACGRKVTIFCNNDAAHRTAEDLLASGIEVCAVVDSRRDAPASGAGYEVIRDARVIRTKGRMGVREITVEEAGRTRNIATDCLAVSGGWNPSVHLSCHMNGRPEWRDDIAAFCPKPGMVLGLEAAGSAAGHFSTSACVRSGDAVARKLLDALGFGAPRSELPVAENDNYSIKPLWSVPGRSRAWLDFQNDVTVRDVVLAAKENFQSVEHMKRYTTQGMAPDQGKNSNVAALAVLADVTGRSIPQTGTTTYRPPFSPVSIAAMGAGAQGMGFAPRRLTASHETSIERCAPMIEAGLWYRPSYFPRGSEQTWRESCDREVRMVRNTVGICDVSTLGKIDIQGAGSAQFLDFVYSNLFSSLKKGRVRYGLMLREDGHVMDDGTTARLDDTHYLMTTTTAAAGQVMRHLEFASQALRPELDVRFASVTEQWAQFAVAGPQSRALLNTLLADPISNEDFPFMACGPVEICGIQGRLFRISFSGEQAYEVAVPSRFGASLFKRLVSEAEALGGGAYGMEALNVMRIEKGHITHAEIHGATTAFDIGFQRMVSSKKDCVGKTMAARPGLVDASRPQLVGLKPLDADAEIFAGAHLFERGAAARRENDQGYVTSVCYSPTLSSYLGLAFLSSGPARPGEVVRLVEALRGIEVLCEVCEPVFFDPQGERLHG